VIYLDSSAVVKLVHTESESAALHAWLAEHPAPLVTSALSRTEACRALTRGAPTAVPALDDIMATMYLAPVDDTVLRAAATLSPPAMRSLDAIQLATALQLAQHLTWFIAYDKRLLAAAMTHDLPTTAPPVKLTGHR
jgi:predicted nucleic acid-binding protein